MQALIEQAAEKRDLKREFPTSSFRLQTSDFRLLPHVPAVLLVFVAEIFEDVSVGLKLVRHLDGEGLRVHLRIVDRNLDVHVAEIAAAIAFHDPHGFAVRVAERVEPCLVVESDRVDDQRVLVPLAD